jgi:environmental stress-induced protein Ves
VRHCPALQLLRAADRIPVPWKNGGGLTSEVAVYPERSGLDDFDWRLSIAEVRAGGPFSVFPGIERQLAVLSGRLVLSIAGGEPLSLSPHSPPLSFAGEAPVLAQPPQGPASDLNLMTRRVRCTGQLTHRTVRAGDPLMAAAHTTVLVALVPLSLAADARQWQLDRLDAALIAQSTPYRLGATGGEGAAYYLAEIEF